MLLTQNFNLGEFKVSKDFPSLAAKTTFTDLDKVKLYYICATILQPLRDLFGQVVILSGKRSSALNTAAKGSNLSDHLFRFVSCATDFTCANVHGAYLYASLNFFQSFGQLIYYPEDNFIHVSLPTPKHHSEVFEK